MADGAASATLIEPAEFEVSEYERRFDVSKSTAERNLVVQLRGADIVRILEEGQGDRYAGVWFDNAAGEFVVPIVSEDVSSTVEADLESASLAGGYRTQSAEFTWAELEAAHRQLDKELDNLLEAQLVQTSLDPKANSIVVSEAKDASKFEAQISAAVVASKARVDVRPIEQERFVAEPFACDVGNRYCDKPLRAGVYIDWAGSHAGACTAGFKALGNAFSNRFVLTAGHCYKGSADWAARNSKNESFYLGHGEEGSYPGGDWAKLRVNGAGFGEYWDEVPWQSLAVYWGGSQNIPIEHESSSYVGESICHSGENTGSSCGTVKTVDVTVNYGEGNVYHLTEAVGLYSSFGDSGGPVWAGNTALGLVSGGVPSSDPSYFAEVTEATSAMGVHIGTQVGAPPSAETAAASSVQARQATGNGKVDPNGLATSFHFDYGTTPGLGSSTGSWGAGSAWGASAVNGLIVGLTPATNYYYRLAASNSAGNGYGAIFSFTTPPEAPTAVLEAPSGVAGGKASLRGTVNPGGASTKYRFEWGTTTAYGNKVPVPDGELGSGTSPKAVEQPISGLKGKTTYFERLFAQNSVGPGEAKGSFTTPDWSPVVATQSAEEVSAKNYKLSGTVNPNGFSTTYKFEYGVGGFENSSETKSLSGSGVQAVALNIGGLKGLTTYKYRLVATNEGNGSKQTNNGVTKEFTTPDWRPSETIAAASDLKVNSAVLHGSVNPHGLETTYQFEYGHTSLYGATSPLVAKGIGAGTASVEVSHEVGGLRPGSSYHFRIKATNSEGTTYSSDEMLTTPVATYVSAFGTAGTGNGQFGHPGGIGETSSGELWIADVNNHRLQKVGAKGEYIAQVTKAGDGQTLYLSGLAVDAKDNVWITDWAHDRVEVFDKAGAFVRRFGSEGTGNGQFDNPEGIAIDSQGNAWVADWANGRVQEFKENGEFIRVAGSKGTEPGQLLGPAAIAVGPSDNVWVADWSGHRVSAFNSQGEYLRRFGSPGTGAGQFTHPVAIAADLTGHVWVADQQNGRVEEFTEKGAYLGQLGSIGSGESQFSFTYPAGILANAEGSILVTDANNNRVQRWETPRTVATYVSAFGTAGTGNGQFGHPGGIGETSSGELWIADVNNHRLQKVGAKGEYIAQVTKAGDGQTLYLSGLAVDAKDNVWITDWAHDRVEVFDKAGAFVRRFGSEGTGNGQFDNPEGIAIDSQGNAWVADWANGRVQEFKENGEFIRVAGSKGTEPGQLLGPAAIAVGPSDNVWVADWSGHRVSAFNSQGEYLRRFGSPGTGAGQFTHPVAIAADLTGHVWVADQQNGRVEEFTEKGAYLGQLGSIGSGESQFSFTYPAGILANAEGSILVTDANNNRVQRWETPRTVATYVSAFGTAGTGNGQFGHPGGIGETSSGELWIADVNNHRLQKVGAKGEYIAQVTKAGDGQTLYLSGLAVDAKDNVWITDWAHDRVEVFDKAGAFVRRFGSEGTGNGQFDNPEGIAIDSQGNAWVADWANGRVQEFKENGEFIRVAGSKGTEPGQLLGPAAIAVGPSDNVWVADWSGHRVSAFNSQGEYLRRFGSPGTGAGQFTHPVAIAADLTGHVWVADQQNGRVEEFTEKGAYLGQLGLDRLRRIAVQLHLSSRHPRQR